MDFDLAIAAKRDPAHGHETPIESGTTVAKTLTFNVTGSFTSQDGAALTHTINSAISSEFHAYIICIHAVDDVDTDAVVTFLQWVRERRDEGIDLRLCASEPHVHRLLDEVGQAGNALMPLDQAINEPLRRKIEGCSDLPKAAP